MSAESYTQRDTAPKGGTPLWIAPTLSLRDHTGRWVTNATLHGAPYVVDFIFTRCPSVCPLLTSKLVQLQHRTQGRALRFVSISVDPEHDDAAALSAYFETWNAREPRWHLLPTRWDSLAPLVAGYRVTVRQSSDSNNRIVHSNLFVLVDGDGAVRGVYDSVEQRDLERLQRDALAISRLAADREDSASSER